MTETMELKGPERSWLELAGGGGVLERDPSAPPLVALRPGRRRSAKQISADVTSI